MPYSLYDGNGWLADGPSLLGWRQLRMWLLAGPEGRAFATAGVTEHPRGLAAEMARIETADPAVRATVVAVRRAAERAEDVLILSDGMGLVGGGAG